MYQHLNMTHIQIEKVLIEINYSYNKYYINMTKIKYYII